MIFELLLIREPVFGFRGRLASISISRHQFQFEFLGYAKSMGFESRWLLGFGFGFCRARLQKGFSLNLLYRKYEWYFGKKR